jgi:hypothetical protein
MFLYFYELNIYFPLPHEEPHSLSNFLAFLPGLWSQSRAVGVKRNFGVESELVKMYWLQPQYKILK